MEGYLEGLVSLDHIVKCVDGKIIVDDFFFALVLLVGEFEVDVDDLLDLLTGLLDLQEGIEYLVHHLRVEDMVVTLLEVVFLQDGLGILPYCLLDILF
jgi:hypothetical protein